MPTSPLAKVSPAVVAVAVLLTTTSCSEAQSPPMPGATSDQAISTQRPPAGAGVCGLFRQADVETALSGRRVSSAQGGYLVDDGVPSGELCEVFVTGLDEPGLTGFVTPRGTGGVDVAAVARAGSAVFTYPPERVLGYADALSAGDFADDSDDDGARAQLLTTAVVGSRTLVYEVTVVLRPGTTGRSAVDDASQLALQAARALDLPLLDDAAEAALAQ
ncbi:hypothetical protein WDV85_09765 [Pseudokineococcus sp. 5B2Z-1]|uniref:hypothetical protein n=1 Tax=Pseudokineococcus sp. 5B2Z-1 TaxID=3132744 RepID=UPI0030A5A635